MPSSPPPAFREITRVHAADDVFDQLVAAILRGELAVGEALPPERVLADRFGVSRIIARQAVHRVAEIGLVRVRQGGATIVLDPSSASDLRVIELFYRLGPYTPRDVRDINERQLLQGHALLKVAALRGTKAQFEKVAAIVEAYAAEGATQEGMLAFERTFWRAIAEAGGNRLYVFEVNWWYRLLEEQPLAHHEVFAPPAARAAFLRELTRRLVDSDGAPDFYLAIVTPVLESFKAKDPARRASASVPPRSRARHS